ncbi:phage major capsid protein [Candidatus Tisiphia endosymbiont of Oplodontha viridula]|uniref:phage major capsid protein n=1 Tax=Candidatus Tisiphia endosymbiont of Oplodontha viridula TaxID=3077925 RepID=UPI0035C8F61C
MYTANLHQNQTIQNLVIKSVTDNSVVISGYASVYNISDQQNDLIAKGAFASADHSSIKFLWQHDWQQPIGVIKSLTEDDYGLKVEAIINNKIEKGKEAIELVRQGAVDSLSIGFNIKQANYNNLNQRIITEAELIEVSIVTFPANYHAKISHITKHIYSNDLKNWNVKQGVSERSVVNLREYASPPKFYEANSLKQKSIHSILMENKMDTELMTKQNSNEMKLNELQEKVYNLENFLSRPEIGGMQDIEHKAAFNNYIRKGSQSELIEKSLNSGAEEGGVLLVPALYNSIISEINARSPMRQLASIETISSNALDIVIEEGSFASGWVGDLQAREETAASKLKQQRIFVHELYAQPKASQTLIDDSAIRIENWLTERLRDSFVKAENDAFINGDGKKRPKGILSKDHDKIQQFDMGNRVTAEKLLDFINLLDEEYLANATFLMNRTTLSEIQKLQDNNGRFIWQQSLSDSLKQTIFGISVLCCSEMPAIKEGNMAIAIGDFKSAYKIIDRGGINIMRDPYTDKPFVKFYAVKRVGGDVVNQSAIKLAMFS